jgi:hypothetical protein
MRASLATNTSHAACMPHVSVLARRHACQRANLATNTLHAACTQAFAAHSALSCVQPSLCVQPCAAAKPMPAQAAAAALD